jgi:hypothetical protein
MTRWPALAVALVLASGADLGACASDDEHDPRLELERRLARARHASDGGDTQQAIDAFHSLASFYRRGGDRRSAAVADLEAAQRLAQLGRWDEAFVALGPSDEDEPESARLARRRHIRAIALERRGDARGAREVVASARRAVTQEDWQRHLAEDARRLGVAYRWPPLDADVLAPLVVLEWGALAALVVVLYRRGARRADAEDARGRV